jgi:hypothetical protein
MTIQQNKVNNKTQLLITGLVLGAFYALYVYFPIIIDRWEQIFSTIKTFYPVKYL